MKKYFAMGAALTVAFAMTSCKSTESAYKKAYEKAQAAQQQVQTQTQTYQEPVQTTPVQTTPVQTTPVQTTPVQTQQDYSNEKARIETLSYVTGAPLKPYGVVVASMSIQTNATALANKLTNEGFKPTIAKAVVNGTDYYRVVAGSFDDKASAVRLRNQLSGRYQGAWLLYSK